MTGRITVRLTPRAGRNGIDGFGEDGALRIRVTAPPLDGAANDALVRVVAKALRLAPSAVTIVSGEASRVKVIEVDGIDEERLRAALSAAAASS